MKTNRYKQAMMAEKIDEQKFEALCNRLKIGVEAPRENSGTDAAAGKRRSKPKFAAALAAALVITSICATTAVAVGSSGWKMEQFFHSNRRAQDDGSGFSMMVNPDEYANDIEVTAVTEVNEKDSDAEIEPKLVSVSGDGHTIVAIIEVDIKDLDLPEEAIKHGSIGFYSTKSNIPCADFSPMLINKEGTIYSYAFTVADIDFMPEEGVTIELINFGYDIGNGFEIAVNGTFKFKVDSESFNTMSDLVKISGKMQVKGATLQLQLNPLGLLVYGSYSELKSLGLDGDKYFLAQGDCFKFRMSDGRILGEEDNFFDTDFYTLVTSVHGWVDFDNDIRYYHYGFNMPVDISEVEAVAVHDVWFELEDSNAEALADDTEAAANTEVPANAEAPAVTDSPTAAENPEGTVVGNE